MKSVRFLNCRIDLSEWNFMPRMETEFWVGKVLEKLSFQKEAKLLQILDMFAGSGCIGIAVLKNIKNCRVIFSDIDKKSLEQIKINLKLNKIPKNRYRVFQSNMFAKIKGRAKSRCSSSSRCDSMYDYIFANPPYVARDRLKEVQPSVLKYEPKMALFGGKKGLLYIKKFLRQAKNFLTEKGVIFLEFSPEQKEDIKKILKREGYKRYYFFKDQFKRCRFVKIKKI